VLKVKVKEEELVWNILQGETPEEVEKRCLAAVGSDLCRDIAELRGEISRAIRKGDLDPTYIIHGDYAVKVVPDDGDIYISKAPLQEAIKDYWPFCSHGHEYPTIHGADYWVCCGEERRIDDDESFREVLSWLKSRLEQEPTSAARRAAVKAIEERLEKLTRYELQLAKAVVESNANWLANYVKGWAAHFAELGRMGDFIEQIKEVGDVLAGLGISVEGVAKAAPSAWPRVIIARVEALEGMFGRGRIEDSIQKCVDAYGSAACGHLAVAREDVLKAIEAQRGAGGGRPEVHYVVSGPFVFEVRCIHGGWAIIEAHRFDKFIENFFPLDSENPSKLLAVYHLYLPYRTFELRTPQSYANFLIELRRWLTGDSPDLRRPPPEVRQAVLRAAAEHLEEVKKFLNNLNAGSKVSV